MKLLSLTLLALLGASAAATSNSEIDAILWNIDAWKPTTWAVATWKKAPTPTNVFNAANIMIDNVSHTYNQNDYTVKWTPLQWAYSVDVFLKNIDIESDYSKIWTVKWSDGKINFKISEKWNYNVKLVPIEDTTFLPAGPEKVYTIKVESVVAPTPAGTAPTAVTPDSPQQVMATPQVWPNENILIWALVVIAVMYWLTRLRANA